MLQRVPESNLESASGDSFRDASTSQDFNSEPTTFTLEATYMSGTDPLNTNKNDDDNDDDDDDYDNDHLQQQQERQSQGENETRPPVHPCISLDQLSQLPNFVGLSNSTSTSNSNSMGTSITSTGSRPSHSSMPSFSSMPSLSSIVDQDLISIGTLSLADSATTSSKGPPTPPFPPILVKLTPPLDDPSFVDHQRLVRQVHVDLARQTMMKTPSTRIRPPSTAFSSSPKQQEQKEWESLQGKTLDVLEGNVFRPTQKINPTNRWQIGNPNIAPLTHTQKLLLPRRGDVQPRLVSRQESDLSMS